MTDSLADPNPASGAYLTPPGRVNNQDPNRGSGSEMNIPNHIFATLNRNNFWLKILKFLIADPDPGSGNIFDPGSGNIFDPGSGMEKIRIRIRNTGAWTY